MTPEELSALLRASRADTPERGSSCPDEHSIAAYVDGTLITGEQERLEQHLADCSHCLTLVGLVSDERDQTDPDAVADATLNRARTLARPGFTRRGFPAPQWAAAATVVLAVGLLVLAAQQPRPSDAISSFGVPTTRTADAPELRLLSPNDGATVDGTQLTVRWSTVPGARYYDVRVVTAAGDVVSEGHVTGTEWRPPNRAALRPGLEYFVQVDAYVSEGKAIGSEHVSFRVLD
jgi:hypothetical protein